MRTWPFHSVQRYTTLVQSLVCYTLPEVYTFLKCKKPHANTLTVRTWDLMLPRSGQVLVTNPDRQLPCHFSKTVLRTPSQRGVPLFSVSYRRNAEKMQRTLREKDTKVILLSVLSAKKQKRHVQIAANQV